MSILEKKGPILVTCPKAIPPFLAREMNGLGFADTRELDAGVLTYGSLSDCMRLNLWVRTGHRVMFELKRFRALDQDDIYREVKVFPWENLMENDGYFTVDASIRDTRVTDERFAALRVKDGVADRFLERFGKRPDSGPDTEKGVCLFLYWRGDSATLYLDTTGEPLSKRGYRKRPHTAPMQETLAAACILASKWPGIMHKGGHFIAPMCGSGTLAIEAVLMALNGAPGLLRDHFGFMRLKGYTPDRWETLCNEAEDQERFSLSGRAIVTDIDPEAVAAAKDNARNAGVADFMEFSVCDFRETEMPDGPGVVMLNPEYGMRLGDEQELAGTYKAIGDFFKQRCAGKTGYIFTGNKTLSKKVGLKTDSRHVFFTAKIECRLLEYEIFAGKR